jgi:hypothetical protein
MTRINYHRLRITFLRSILGGLFVAAAVTCFGVPQIAHAASCGDTLISGADWMHGLGVDVHSNAPYDGDPSGNDCGGVVHDLSANPPQWGDAWQCVEMPQRLYNTRGWYSGNFAGVSYAAQIFTKATDDGWTATAQGSVDITKIVPGDMLVTHEATYGHVFIVNSVDTVHNTINAVDQNGADGGSTTVSFNPSTKNLSDGNYFQFSGVVHSPNNGGGGGGSGGGTITGSRLSAVSMTNGQQMVFWKGGDNNLWAAYWSGSAWYKQNLGFGTLNSPPAAVYQPSTGWIQVFWEGPGHRLYQAVESNGSWVGGWDMNVGSTVYSQPTAAVTGNQVDVFWKDNGGTLQETVWNGTAWVAFNLGSNFWNMASAPAAFDQSSGENDVFWTDIAGNLVEGVWNGGAWVGFSLPVGLISSQPSADQESATGFQDVFWKDGSNLKEAVYNGAAWVNFTVPGATTLATAPTSTTWGSQIDVFWTDSAGNMDEAVWNGAAWVNFQVPNMGPIPSS